LLAESRPELDGLGSFSFSFSAACTTGRPSGGQSASEAASESAPEKRNSIYCGFIVGRPAPRSPKHELQLQARPVPLAADPIKSNPLGSAGKRVIIK